ncbi:MAG: hypothetical protein C4547_10485 [Phycisphaerales bacterium]|nr:MAG: hypothetical protein C4547_10485 [Phycisphaerales bacterium]
MLTEAAWLVRKKSDGVKRLFELVEAGVINVTALDELAPPWVSQFIQKYTSVGAQVADAALMYLAEQLGTETVFTTDRRDFSVYRTSSGRAMRIVPAPV